MDWVSRAVLAWRLSNTLGADFCVEALDEALSRHGRPEIFNTDQGSQFVDIQPPTSRVPKSIGHQHLLEPALRTKKGAHDFAQHLLTKAAERLRRGDYYCRRLGAHLSWVGDLGGWWDETDFHETRDTGFLLARLEELWQRMPRYKPLSVGVVLLDLVPANHHQPDLFAADNGRRQKLSPLIDRINDRYGRCSIGFGLFPADVRAFKGHAAFHRVPERWEF